MKKLAAVIAALMLPTAAASADYLQIADEAELSKPRAAQELRDYVYQSGAAKDPSAERRRLYIYNYLLQLEKQELDFRQSLYTYEYELSGKDKRLDFMARRAYENAEAANALDLEIKRGEAYLSRLSSDRAVLEHADRLAERLTEEKPKSKAPVYAALSAAVLGLSALLFSALKKYAVKHGLI